MQILGPMDRATIPLWGGPSLPAGRMGRALSGLTGSPDDPLPRRTARLLLRRLGVSDLADFQAYRCDPEVQRYQGWEIMTSLEAKGFLDRMATVPLLQPGQWSQVGVALQDSNRLIGDLGIRVSKDAGEAELGITLHPLWHHRGLATEACGEAIRWVWERTPVTHILGVTDTRNGPSVRLLQRVGMRPVHQRHVEFRGEPCEELVCRIDRGATGPGGGDASTDAGRR